MRHLLFFRLTHFHIESCLCAVFAVFLLSVNGAASIKLMNWKIKHIKMNVINKVKRKRINRPKEKNKITTYYNNGHFRFPFAILQSGNSISIISFFLLPLFYFLLLQTQTNFALHFIFFTLRPDVCVRMFVHFLSSVDI